MYPVSNWVVRYRPEKEPSPLKNLKCIKTQKFLSGRTTPQREKDANQETQYTVGARQKTAISG
jgi:hypothetical protein